MGRGSSLTGAEGSDPGGVDPDPAGVDPDPTLDKKNTDTDSTLER